MENTHLFFNTSIGVKKPESIRNKEASCPFCARSELTGIIAEEGSIMLLKNKYPVLENAFQTVLIETDECDSELSIYSHKHLIQLIEFGLSHWLNMMEEGEYKSVLFFKNHGPLSGGSIAHPHMQIVGLHDIDYLEHVEKEHFDGLPIHENNQVSLNLSTKPRVGFYEFNVRMENLNKTETFALYIQTAAHYILHEFPFPCKSYNIFFYHFNGDIIAKIIPRFVTTPILIGYSIPQVPSNLNWVREDVVKKYF